MGKGKGRGLARKIYRVERSTINVRRCNTPKVPRKWGEWTKRICQKTSFLFYIWFFLKLGRRTHHDRFLFIWHFRPKQPSAYIVVIESHAGITRVSAWLWKNGSHDVRKGLKSREVLLPITRFPSDTPVFVWVRMSSRLHESETPYSEILICLATAMKTQRFAFCFTQWERALKPFLSMVQKGGVEKIAPTATKKERGEEAPMPRTVRGLPQTERHFCRCYACGCASDCWTYAEAISLRRFAPFAVVAAVLVPEARLFAPFGQLNLFLRLWVWVDFGEVLFVHAC